jgi:hypothetical protein
MKYLEIFKNKEDIEKEFEIKLPKNIKILLAFYEYENYSGSAFVLFELDGKLYEVNGSHCSCYGLEGQWEPEETSVIALEARLKDGYMEEPVKLELPKVLKKLQIK